MTVKEIADKCGVSEQSIRAWCRRNNIAKVPQAAENGERKVAKPAYLITDEVAERIISVVSAVSVFSQVSFPFVSVVSLLSLLSDCLILAQTA